MNTPSYIMQNSHGIWHLRLAVPKRLRYVIGKREIKKTLRTRYKGEALRKARKLAVFYLERFEAMSDLDDLINNPLINKLGCDIIKHPDGRVEIKNLEMDADKSAAEMKMLDHAVDRANKLTPTTTILAPGAAPAEDSELLLKDLIEEYLDVVEENVDNAKTLKGYRSHAETFLEILGSIPITQVNRKLARDSVTTLRKLPPNRKKLRAYRDLSIDSILALKPTKVFSKTTVKLHVERITAIFQFAKEEEYLEKNPFDNILKTKQTTPAHTQRKIFTNADLTALFQPAAKRSKNGYPSRDWIPLIAAFSGLRLEEIAQLNASDIQVYDGIDCFDINSNNDNKLKNASADRIVPIHSKLLSKYFLLYVQDQRGGKLFPELNRANGKYGHHFSKWFGRYRKKCGVTISGKTFHSFRHTAVTQLQQANIPVEKAAAIMGHTVNGETYGRYGKGFLVKQLQEVIETLNYGHLIP